MAKGNKIEGGFSGLSQLKKTLPENSKGSKSNDHSNQSQGYKVKDSFDISKTQVPKDTQEALMEFDSKDFDNFYLKLNQFARFDIADKKKPDEKKFIFYRHKAKDLEDIEIKVNFGDFDFKDNLKKQKESIEAIFGEKNTYKKDFTTSSSLVIGGEATVYETSMRLHHIYGIPYIPASGIKGVVRSYIITEKFATELENYKDRYMKFEEEVLFAKDKEGEYIEKEFVDVFGSQDHAGEVTFFDAFPTAKPTLKVDIINPIDEDKIINFLTVENTTFRFMMGAKDELKTFKIGENTIETWLVEALKNHGLGAKTAVGYGYF